MWIMREILFKAKCKDNGKWVEGWLLKDEVTGQYFIHASGNSVNESDKVNEEGCLQFVAFEVEESTICQYTGLTDKNGNKIWENDVVKATVRQNSLCQSSSYSDFYQISYQEKYCYFYLKKKNNNLLFDGNWSYYLKSIEVIGNIFDKLGLMKGQVEE